jgi:hypothetical protein
VTRRNIDIPDEIWRAVAIKAAEEGKAKRDVVIEAIWEHTRPKIRRDGE